MKLNKIKLNNFRQYCGENIFEFATGNDQNITIIKGENTEGKTSLFRAMIFALYGETTIAQDNGQKNNDNLINDYHFHMAETPQPGKVTWVEGSVFVEFLHNSEKFELTRKIEIEKLNSGTAGNSFISGELYIIDEKGNRSPKPISSEEELKEKLSFLSYDIKDFFFFDGEEIRNVVERKKLRSAIKKMMGIDSIYDAKSSVKNLYNQNLKEIQNSNTNRSFNDLSTRKENLETEIQRINNIIEVSSRAIEALEVDVSNIRTDISGRTSADVLTKYDEISKSIRDEEAKLNVNKNKLQEILEYAPALLISHKLNTLNQRLQNRAQAANLGFDWLEPKLIDSILKQRRCICGNEIDSGSEESLNNLKQQLEGYTQYDFDTNLNRHLSTILDPLSETQVRLREAIKERIDILNNIDSLSQSKGALREQQDEARRTQDRMIAIQNKEADIIKYKEAIKTNEKDLTEKNKELQEIERKLEHCKGLGQEEKVLQRMTIKYKELERFYEAFIQKYTEDMRNQISNYATDIFLDLVKENGEGQFREIRINKDFEISAYDQNNNLITPDASGAQKRFLALSYATAIFKYASNRNETDSPLPLFIDTPFGPLDLSNRESIIKKLPEKTNQLIFLLTSTELTQTEEHYFLEGGRVGRVWNLVQERKTIDSNEYTTTRVESSTLDRGDNNDRV
jgi:DNA sulfur modification protein DndD